MSYKKYSNDNNWKCMDCQYDCDDYNCDCLSNLECECECDD